MTRLITAIALLLILAGTCQLRGDVVDLDSVQVERLEGLCRLWGAIEYFHPYVAYKDINWDSALIKTIPQVIESNTAKEYRRAIEFMLSFMQDPNTYIVDEPPYTPASISDFPDGQDYPSIEWTDDSIAVVVVADYNLQDWSFERGIPGDWGRMIRDASRESRGLIFDFRHSTWPPKEFVEKSVIRDKARFFGIIWFSKLIERKMTTPAVRRRVHTWKWEQSSSVRPNRSSGFFYEDSYTIMPEKSIDVGPQDIPIVLIVDQGNDELLPLMGALQDSRQGYIVHEGYFARELGVETYRLHLPDSIAVDIRMTEIIREDGSEGVHPDFVLPYVTDTTLMESPPIKVASEMILGTWNVPAPAGQFISPVVSPPEFEYPETVYPDFSGRMLAIARIWNEIRYFYPFRDTMHHIWESALPKYIQTFAGAVDSIEYAFAVAELVNVLSDVNAGINSETLNRYTGYFYPPFGITHIEGKTVVCSLYGDGATDEDNSGYQLRRGDVILAIDGISIDSLLNRYSRYLPVSPDSRMRWRANQMLLGDRKHSQMQLTVVRHNGDTVRTVEERTVEGFPFSCMAIDKQAADDRILFINPNSNGDALRIGSSDTIFHHPAVIIDLRGTYSYEVEDLARHLVREEIIAGYMEGVERWLPDIEAGGRNRSPILIKPADNGFFSGPVAVLINEGTVGYTEYLSLIFSACEQVTLFGRTTAGHPGRNFSFDVPGEMSVFYTGVESRFPNGTSVLGRGIDPDIHVERTLSGIRAGRDEVFDAAVEYLSGILDAEQ